jgi:acyl-CoA synthetase (NDP forming)
VQVAEECGKKGVKGLIIITSGFSEVGQKDLERQVVETANRYGTRVLALILLAHSPTLIK